MTQKGVELCRGTSEEHGGRKNETAQSRARAMATTGGSAGGRDANDARVRHRATACVSLCERARRLKGPLVIPDATESFTVKLSRALVAHLARSGGRG